MGWDMLIYAVISAVISYGITMLTAPTPDGAKAGALDIPSATDGGPIPVGFGTNIIKQSNIIWFGDTSTSPIRKSGGK